MNDHEIQRIAASMHELRPDWPASSLITLIRKHLADKPRRDVCVALAWVACESGTATPARVLETGPWWRAAGIEGSTTAREPYDVNKTCGICEKTEPRCQSIPEHISGHTYIPKPVALAAVPTEPEAYTGDLRDRNAKARHTDEGASA